MSLEVTSCSPQGLQFHPHSACIPRAAILYHRNTQAPVSASTAPSTTNPPRTPKPQPLRPLAPTIAASLVPVAGVAAVAGAVAEVLTGEDVDATNTVEEDIDVDNLTAAEEAAALVMVFVVAAAALVFFATAMEELLLPLPLPSSGGFATSPP